MYITWSIPYSIAHEVSFCLCKDLACVIWNGRVFTVSKIEKIIYLSLEVFFIQPKIGCILLRSQNPHNKKTTT